MANHTITITNSLNAFGPAPSTKWGTGTPYTMTWGTSKWGEGTEDLPVSIDKVIENSITPDGSTLSFDVTKNYSNDLTVTSETSMETLQSGNGYYYVFVKPSTDAEDRNLSTYTESSDPSTSYTSGTVTSTSWS